jgi:hypothetical protein
MFSEVRAKMSLVCRDQSSTRIVQIERIITDKNNGFTILNQYGDWDYSALTAESAIMIFICAHRDAAL